MIEFLNWLDGSTIATVILLIMAVVIAWLFESLLSAKRELQAYMDRLDSEELVDKVAKAQYEEGYVLADTNVEPWGLWSKLSKEWVDRHKEVARAAIKAVKGE